MLTGVTRCAKRPGVLGISVQSIYTWQQLFSRPVQVIQEVDTHPDEFRRLKRELARVTEERAIRKKVLAGSTGRRNDLFKGII